MIPEYRLSSETIKGQLLNPWSRRAEISHHWGPIALNDPTMGLFVQLWTARVIGSEIYLSAPNYPEALLLGTDEEVTEVSLAFDQNGQAYLAFVEDGEPKLYWYDPLLLGFDIIDLPSDTINPRITLDDARLSMNGRNDIILGYVRDGVLRYRQQRDRYTIEYTLSIGEGGGPARATGLRHISMNSQLRLEFLTTDAGDEPWTLAEVVTDLLRRSDVSENEIDVTNLYSYTVDGYRIANEGGADSNIVPLTQAWFFDPGEWDKKLRFVLRGGEPVAHLTFDDLLEREDNGPFRIERAQEIELLRKVNVTMVDNTAGWIANKQTAERRSATIKAVGEQSAVLPITAHPDFIATVATKRLRIPWAEPYKFAFGLGAPWSALTATDIITLTDPRGHRRTIRLGQIDEDYGTFTFDAGNNAAWVYKQTAAGSRSPNWNPTIPGQVGDTTLIILDIPVLYDQDDELGYYVAVLGEGDGWRGARVQMRLIGLGGPMQEWDVADSSTVGKTTTTLSPERDGEYLSEQKIRVQMLDGQLSTSTRDGVLNGANLAAVQRADKSWELLQFQTAINLDNGLYELSGLVRGRYATEPKAIAEGAWFVLIDSGVTFVQAQRSMVGWPIAYRAVSFGQNGDDITWTEFFVEYPATQDEWPVHMLRADRDGGTVTTTWIDRGRLGSDTVPYHSKYFDGFNVDYSDGPSYKVADGSNMHVRSGVPANVTITVSPLNRATQRAGRGRSITV